MISFQEGWEATFGAAFAGAFLDAGFFAAVFLVLEEEAGRVSIGGGETEVLEDIATVECDLSKTDVWRWNAKSAEFGRGGDKRWSGQSSQVIHIYTQNAFSHVWARLPVCW